MHLFLWGESQWVKVIERLAARWLCCVSFLPRAVEPTKITKCLMVTDFRGRVHEKLVFRQRCKSYVDMEMLKERGNVEPCVGPKVTLFYAWETLSQLQDNIYIFTGSPKRNQSHRYFSAQQALLFTDNAKHIRKLNGTLSHTLVQLL